MKRIFLAIFLTLISISFSSGATRTEVNILEATEAIRYLSQKITKDYLYIYINPKKRDILNQIKDDINSMVSNIRKISITTNDEDTKNILDFLTYSKEQIEELIKEKPTKERAALMLDYSETLLEGANSIAKEHSYEFTESEKMLIIGATIKYLAERAAKYYMALSIGLSSDVNKKQMRLSIKELEEKINVVYYYSSYPQSLISSKTKLIISWKILKKIFKKRDRIVLTNIVYLTTDEIEKLIQKFILYHRRNQ